MKVLAFNGSPRKDGNTHLLLEKALKPVSDVGIQTKLIQIGNTGIKPCNACFACTKQQNKKCVFDDDILNECLSEMLDADAFILGSPSYFSAMTPELKSLIDRAGFVSHANGGLFRHKLGAAVVAQRRGGGTSVLDSINYMFLMSQMFVVGSTYWNFGNGLDKGDVLKDEEALFNMQNLGENIVWLLSKINK